MKRMALVQCGCIGYREAWALQRRLFDALLAQKGLPGEQVGTLLLCQHEPVYTLGRHADPKNVLLDPAAIEALGATLVRTDRGGDVTFHGPGQWVAYPVVDLERLHLSLKAYIRALEEAVIAVAARYGVVAGRIEGAPGVWVGCEEPHPRKLCAIGVRSSRYVVMHGLALNVATPLDWFQRIHPCGFRDRGVTSLEAETGRRMDMDEVGRALVEQLMHELNVEI